MTSQTRIHTISRRMSFYILACVLVAIVVPFASERMSKKLSRDDFQETVDQQLADPKPPVDSAGYYERWWRDLFVSQSDHCKWDVVHTYRVTVALSKQLTVATLDQETVRTVMDATRCVNSSALVSFRQGIRPEDDAVRKAASGCFDYFEFQNSHTGSEDPCHIKHAPPQRLLEDMFNRWDVLSGIMNNKKPGFGDQCKSEKTASGVSACTTMLSALDYVVTEDQYSDLLDDGMLCIGGSEVPSAHLVRSPYVFCLLMGLCLFMMLKADIESPNGVLPVLYGGVHFLMCTMTYNLHSNSLDYVQGPTLEIADACVVKKYWISQDTRGMFYCSVQVNIPGSRPNVSRRSDFRVWVENEGTVITVKHRNASTLDLGSSLDQEIFRVLDGVPEKKKEARAQLWYKHGTVPSHTWMTKVQKKV